MAKTAAIFIFYNGELLIVKDEYHWKLPGGKIEEAETGWDTILRETWMATNILITGDHVKKFVDLGSHKKLHLFRVVVSEIPELKCHLLRGKPLEYKWVKKEDCPKYLPQYLCKKL